MKQSIITARGMSCIYSLDPCLANRKAMEIKGDMMELRTEDNNNVWHGIEIEADELTN